MKKGPTARVWISMDDGVGAAGNHNEPQAPTPPIIEEFGRQCQSGDASGASARGAIMTRRPGSHALPPDVITHRAKPERHSMIVAAVDDLLFSSLVLIALDAERIQPLEALARLRGDAGTAGVRTLGFVSHVHASLIQAAREAGIGEVVARSTFVAALPDLVAGAR